jgi:hypothetical protein
MNLKLIWEISGFNESNQLRIKNEGATISREDPCLKKQGDVVVDKPT